MKVKIILQNISDFIRTLFIRYLLSSLLTLIIFIFIFFSSTTKYLEKKLNFRINREVLLTNYEIKNTQQQSKSKNKNESLKKEMNNKKNQKVVSNNKTKNSQNSLIKTKNITYYPDFNVDYLPIYPTIAKRMHQEGSVKLSIYINNNGQIIRIVITQSSGYKLLDDAAIDAVKKWDYTKFLDKYKNDYIITTTISFKLE